jgi:hypothetical protein
VIYFYGVSVELVVVFFELYDYKLKDIVLLPINHIGIGDGF